MLLPSLRSWACLRVVVVGHRGVVFGCGAKEAFFAARVDDSSSGFVLATSCSDIFEMDAFFPYRSTSLRGVCVLRLYVDYMWSSVLEHAVCFSLAGRVAARVSFVGVDYSLS